MGTSHFTSNIKGNVAVTVASVTATNLVIGDSVAISGSMTVGNTAKITTLASAPTVHGSTKVRATSYFQAGASQYIFFGARGKSASIIADATALVATPIKGSMYLSTRGELWVFTTDAAASPLTGTFSSP